MTETEKKVVDWGKVEWYATELKRLTGKILVVEVERHGYDKLNQHTHNDINDFWFTLDGEHIAQLYKVSFDVMEIFLLGLKRMAEALYIEPKEPVTRTVRYYTTKDKSTCKNYRPCNLMCSICSDYEPKEKKPLKICAECTHYSIDKHDYGVCDDPKCWGQPESIGYEAREAVKE